MHLAIVSPFPPTITGIGQYGYHMTRALAGSHAFNRISVLTAQTSASQGVAYPPRVSVERVWRMDRADAGWRIAARLNQLKPDLVWFNLGTTAFGRSTPVNISGLLSPGLARALGIPSVLTMHEMVELSDLRLLRAPGGPLSWLGARWVTAALTQADVVCLTLKRYADWLAARCPGLPTVHIPIGAYNPPQILPEPPHPELLFFTTLAPFKGLELLLETFRRLRGGIPGLRLTVAGAEHARFPGYTSGLRLENSDLSEVRWLGYLPEEEIREVFSRSQVMVLPYQAATGSSSVLYQSMVWGRAVAASDLPELRAEAEEGGLEVEFFRNGDPGDLARALERLLCSPELRRRQVEHNARAMRRMSLANSARGYLRAFNLSLELHSSAERIAIPPELSVETAG
jgi:glycosyltransferase involved in cell wall biosynthesis